MKKYFCAIVHQPNTPLNPAKKGSFVPDIFISYAHLDNKAFAAKEKG